MKLSCNPPPLLILQIDETRRKILHFLLSTLALGDVGVGPDDANPVNHRPACEEPADTAVLLKQPVFFFEPEFSVKHPFFDVPDKIDIVGMTQPDPII